ncbi:Chromosome segregation protein sudA [Nosema granulosis]|uniref:Chromosome segregation protein sudA n=1 Tax=Nosema granulosis TaxID=83296 RepID=A0A9P6KZZ0_9MICR|nr:Chromosome segregation protein sudA [Nosema granulosis]
MRINKILLTNFKSFKDTTEIILHRNCNVIVGKNGSGKSNLMSAIQLIVCCPRLDISERQNVVHEGSETTSIVEIEFDNSSRRFHGPRLFRIKREISMSKDEFYVDDNKTSREEIKGMFENAGVPVSSPYFMVLQGKINSLAVMTDEQRFNLIKNVAGVSKYEEDRGKSLEMLEETKHTQDKVEGILERIEDKLEGLEKDKILLEECEALENEKRRCEIAYSQLEILELNKAIKEVEAEEIEETEREDSEEAEDLEFQLREVRKEIENALNEKTKIQVDFIDKEKLKSIESKLAEISKQIQSHTERKKKVEEAFEDSLVEFKALKMLKDGKKENNLEIENLGIEGVEENKKGNEFVYDVNALKMLVEKRNEMWREERILKGTLKSIEENLQATGNKMVLSGQNDLSNIKTQEGVLGTVVDLFEVPDELMVAYEAVAGGFLFNVVVKDETVAARLSKDFSNVTFIPLNRMFYKEPIKVEGDNLFLMASEIKASEDTASLLRYITKNAYVCSDVKSSNIYSQKFNINVVTLEGDVFNKSGVIVGGYEKKKNILIDYKKQTKEKRKAEGDLRYLLERIKKVSQEISMFENCKNENINSSNLRNRILLRYSKEKENFTSLKRVERRIEDLNLKIPTMEIEVEEIKGTLSGLLEKLQKYNKVYMELNVDTSQDLKIIQERIHRLQAKEKSLVESLRKKEVVKVDLSEDLEKEKRRAKRHVLYSKRLALMNKIGVDDYKGLKMDTTKEDLLKKLREIQTSLKKYVMINRRAITQWKTHLDQKDALKTRLEDLKGNLENIKKFIQDLDGKKEQFLDFTLELFKTHFANFSKTLCGNALDLVREGDGLCIFHQGDPVDLNILSGGQKTMIALCLIFSIQKIDPSPFYIFDEADANLDKQSREKITNLFKETEEAQIIISTFKEELVECGNKFIGISFSDKKSYAGEVTKEIVCEFLNE